MSSTAIDSTALRLTGKDVLAVLHRVTTQKLDDLAPGQARTTLFCEYRGRLLHRATVVHAPDGAVWLLRHDAPGAGLAAAVDRVVFREDVKIADRSGELAVRLVHVPQGANADAKFTADGTPLLAGESEGFALALGAGAAPSPEVDEVARITAGHARHGSEVCDAFTPYDVNLSAHVHLDKGCFTGQEVLLRLVTRDKVLRRLVRVAGTGAVPEPQDVLANGEPVGRLTSATATADGWLALAVMRMTALAAGGAFALADGSALRDLHAFEIARPLGRP
jgi:folate-binding protein YgfZ